MRIHSLSACALLSLATALPLASRAQESSINTYSPYTLYGLGSLSGAGNTNFVGMGGASIGFRNAGFDSPGDVRLNVSNPASLSAIAPKSFILDAGMAGSNVYMRQNSGDGAIKTSFNTFNVNNVTIAFPIARRLGFALNVSPYSQVGYRIQKDDLSYLADLGVVRYYYDGEGELNEAKAAMGWEPFKNFSIGAEFIYMFGNINRNYQAMIGSYTGSGSYYDFSSLNGSIATTNEKIGRVFGAFGVQYTPLDKAKSRLTIGATYRLGGKLNSTVTDFIPSNNIYGDTIRFEVARSTTRMPQVIGAGLYFHKPKWAVGVDYLFHEWSRNGYDADNRVRFVDTHTVKLGVQYTPNRYDIRGKFGSFFNRITYKAGFRYNNNYLEFGGRSLSDKAVTVGFDVPFAAMTVSNLSIGVELGEKGRLGQDGAGRQLIRERYFKINVGMMLFGRDYDYWFEKYKYN